MLNLLFMKAQLPDTVVENRQISPILLGIFILLFIFSLNGCQSAPPVEEKDIDEDVCIGEAVILDQDTEVDLEEMARGVECP